MSILSIITTPNPILKEISKEVLVVDDNIRKIFDDMLETMKHANGAGLAAVQVGILKRMMIVDISEDIKVPSNNPIFMVNPEIIYMSEEHIVYQEGCLSFPGGFSDISRPLNVKVKYLDYHGNKKEMEATGWLARAIEHEIDHLNGIVMTDYMSKLKAQMLLKKVEKAKKNLV
jgi:peptide deformylase